MRYLDAAPALPFVQQAAGIRLDRETGKRLSFHDSHALFAALDAYEVETFARLRMKFVAAGTLQLARSIVHTLIDKRE